MQTVTDADGTVHQFPDDATPDEMTKALGGNAGAGNPPTPVPAAGSAAPASNQPSFSSQLLGNLSGGLRAFNRGLTGGLWDPTVGAAKSLFGGQLGQNIAAEQARTNQAEQQMGPGMSAALEAGGMMLGPGKLSAVERAPSLLPRLIGSGAESGAYTGAQALLQGQPTLKPTLEGAAVGTVVPAVAAGGSKIASKFPGMGVPDIPAGADLRAGTAFKTAQTYNTADKLDMLENMRYNAANTGSSLPAQVHSLLSKDVQSGTSKADELGFTGPEQNALAKVGATTPIASFMVQHPRMTQGTVAAMGEVPAMMFGLHGNLPEAMAAEAIATAGHVGAAIIPNKFANAGAQRALDAVGRQVAGVPQTGQAQDWLNNPNINRTLWNIVANRYAGQQ